MFAEGQSPCGKEKKGRQQERKTERAGQAVQPGREGRIKQRDQAAGSLPSACLESRFVEAGEGEACSVGLKLCSGQAAGAAVCQLVGGPVQQHMTTHASCIWANTQLRCSRQPTSQICIV